MLTLWFFRFEVKYWIRRAGVAGTTALTCRGAFLFVFLYKNPLKVEEKKETLLEQCWLCVALRLVSPLSRPAAFDCPGSDPCRCTPQVPCAPRPSRGRLPLPSASRRASLFLAATLASGALALSRACAAATLGGERLHPSAELLPAPLGALRAVACGQLRVLLGNERP